jgi:hypothetical protein
MTFEAGGILLRHVYTHVDSPGNEPRRQGHVSLKTLKVLETELESIGTRHRQVLERQSARLSLILTRHRKAHGPDSHLITFAASG